MNKQIRLGLGFGLTSGIITTLGLIVGLQASTESRLVVISGILVIALCDALSDAFGMHVAEEAEQKREIKNLWVASLVTFLSKAVFSMSYAVFFFLLAMNQAVYLSIAWSLFLISIFGYYIAKLHGHSPWKVVSEHVVVAVLVILASHLIGTFIHSALF